MKRTLNRDIPKGAAVTIVALVLVASVVTGREEERDDARPRALASVPASSSAQPVLAEDLDLERLKRERQESPPPDLFASRPPPEPAAVAMAKPAPPPTPSAPPLPFKYLGRMADETKLVIFLERNEESLAVRAGDTIEGTYQVERVSETAAQFVYLPLGIKQTLNYPMQP